MRRRLTKLTADEVSLVHRGANRKRFLIIKEDRMSDVLKAVLESELENDEQVTKALTEAKVSEQGIEAMKGVIRLVKAFQDELPQDCLAKAAALADYGYAKPEKKPKKQDEEEDEEEEVEEQKAKAKKKAGCDPDMKEKLKKEDLDSLPESVRKAIADMQADHAHILAEREEFVRKAQELEKEVERQRDEQLQAAFVEKVRGFTHLPVSKPEEFGAVLKQVSVLAPGVYPKLEAVLKAADEALKQAKSLGAVGSDGRNSLLGGDAWRQIEALASQLVQKDSGMTRAKAVVQVMDEHPELYQQYLAEKARQNPQ